MWWILTLLGLALALAGTDAFSLGQMLAVGVPLMNMNNSGGHGGHGDHGGHKMYFHHSAHSTILFQQWHTMTWAQLAGSCVVVGIAATLYEGLKVGRQLLLSYMTKRDRPGFQVTPSHNAKQMSIQESKPSIRASMFSSSHILQAVLHFFQVVFSYCLMLVFMTYNVWLCLAVSLGSAVGYFLFAWKRDDNMHDDGEHCN